MFALALPQSEEDLPRGVLPGTGIATPSGWRAVEALAPGDQVMTLADGPRQITAILEAPPPLWLQVLPPLACGNRDVLALPPGQRILIESPLAMPVTGDAFALIQVEALEGWRGVTAIANRDPVLVPELDRPALIYAGPGLILCCNGRWGQSPHHLPNLAESRGLVARMMAEDVEHALAPGGV